MSDTTALAMHVQDLSLDEPIEHDDHPQQGNANPNATINRHGHGHVETQVDIEATNPHTDTNLEFHPTFAPPSGSLVILRTEDQKCFLVDVALLVQHSTFFADLMSLSGAPAATSSSWTRPEVIDLPSATSAGLTLVLLVLRSKRGEYPKITYERLRDVRAAMQTADAYDFHNFLKDLMAHFRDEPFTRFTIAAIAKDEKAAKEISGEIELDITSTPSAIEDLLTRVAPDYHRRLRNLLGERTDLKRDFLWRFKFGKDMTPDDFSSKCRRGDGCAGSQIVNGNFQHLRNRAGNGTQKSLERIDRYPGYYLSREAITNAVECRTCSNRFAITFEREIRLAWDGLPTTI